jgi:hypothetical protein
MAHGKWSEVEARGMLAALAKSGLSIEEFARERGFVQQRIYYWRKRIAELDEQRPQLLPVAVRDDAPRRGEPVTLLLRSGHMMKLANGFDEEAFLRVITLLERG